MGTSDMAKTYTLCVRLPWWWRPYLWALAAFHNSGLVVVNPEAVGAFAARHIRVTTQEVR